MTTYLCAHQHPDDFARRWDELMNELGGLRHFREQVSAFHRAWGDTDTSDLDLLALWEDLGRLLGGAA